MVTAKQRAARRRFVQRFAHGRRHSRKLSGGVKTMARRRSRGRSFRRRSGRRGGMGGIMGLVVPFIAGAAGGAIAPRLPIANQLPSPVAGAAAGWLVKKSLIGAAAGAAGQLVGTPYLAGMLGGGSRSGGAVQAYG